MSKLPNEIQAAISLIIVSVVLVLADQLQLLTIAGVLCGVLALVAATLGIFSPTYGNPPTPKKEG